MSDYGTRIAFFISLLSFVAVVILPEVEGKDVSVNATACTFKGKVYYCPGHDGVAYQDRCCPTSTEAKCCLSKPATYCGQVWPANTHCYWKNGGLNITLCCVYETFTSRDTACCSIDSDILALAGWVIAVIVVCVFLFLAGIILLCCCCCSCCLIAQRRNVRNGYVNT